MKTHHSSTTTTTTKPKSKYKANPLRTTLQPLTPITPIIPPPFPRSSSNRTTAATSQSRPQRRLSSSSTTQYSNQLHRQLQLQLQLQKANHRTETDGKRDEADLYQDGRDLWVDDDAVPSYESGDQTGTVTGKKERRRKGGIDGSDGWERVSTLRREDASLGYHVRKELQQQQPRVWQQEEVKMGNDMDMDMDILEEYEIEKYEDEDTEGEDEGEISCSYRRRRMRVSEIASRMDRTYDVTCRAQHRRENDHDPDGVLREVGQSSCYTNAFNGTKA
ncbi:hypothetical protein DL98DRAFT_574580 [Cadophora sp. DSE1049]|nr:hypothetical protein DL98DRAFT_574580 [Cadophora sp. DSE1049]